MKRKIVTLLFVALMTHGCNQTSFSTETEVENTAESALNSTSNGSAANDTTAISLERINSDIKEGKVKGWESAQTQQDRYLALLNHLRSQSIKCNDARGYSGPQPAVVWNDALEEAAIAHSEDLLEHSQLGHRGSNGSTAAQRVKLHGFSGEYIGENVGYKNKSGIAYSGKEWIELFVGWIKSTDGHCSNIMSPEYNTFGMGEAKSEEGNSVTLFWTQDFGKI